MPASPKAFELHHQDDVAVVRVNEAKMAYATLEDLQRELALAIEVGCVRKMVVNLAPVAFLDSFGIGVIVVTARKMSQAGGQLKLCGVGERVRMSLTITRLDRTLDIVADEAEAVRSLGAQA